LAHGGWFGQPVNLSPENITERFQTMFREKAEILGISTEDFKTAWSQGKDLREMAQEQGITKEQLQEKMQEKRKEQMQEQLNVLVQNGVITQEQANNRMGFLENRFENRGLGEGFGRHSNMGGCIE